MIYPACLQTRIGKPRKATISTFAGRAQAPGAVARLREDWFHRWRFLRADAHGGLDVARAARDR
jgi:hypothetical protein